MLSPNVSPLSVTDIISKPRLRFMTCGSVDDGKSTLVGRLLQESGAIYEDQLAEALKAGGSSKLDLSFLLDGLKAEREQGITIDVAYRYFMTSRRAFLIADAPGHEQYTRNQAAAASQTDIALVLISAVDGIRVQTRRHAAIAALFGVKNLLFLVNKMDLVGWSEDVFDCLSDEVEALAKQTHQQVIHIIPVSALEGGNIVNRSDNAPWYNGPTVLDVLETFEPATHINQPFALSVQHVSRLPNGGRLLLGEVSAGRVHQGMALVTQDGHDVTVAEMWSRGIASTSALAGEPIALRLQPERDIGRGSVIREKTAPGRRARQCMTRLVWLSNEPLQQGRDYSIHMGTASDIATVSRVQAILDPETLMQNDAKASIPSNGIGICKLTLAQGIFCQKFQDHQDLGAFILVDRVTHETVAAGVVLEIEQTVDDLPWQSQVIQPNDRAGNLRQKPKVYWLTGLSGAGKSTIANICERQVSSQGRATMLLDGDNLRHGLNADLGFSDADRIENMRRVAHVAALMADAGLIVIVALISPFSQERARARDIIGVDRFAEVFIDTPMDICQQRDPKGHYTRAAKGNLAQFTGVASGYDVPQSPDIHIRTADMSPEQSAHILLQKMLDALD